MKKIVFLIGISITITACTSNGSKSTQDTTPVLSQTNNESRSLTDTLGNEATTENSTAFNKGKELITKSDCLSCHKEHEKLVGPAYTAVAAKYEDTDANISALSAKIIAGGKGVWGEIPMTPHPALSKDDAAEMVKYILSLK